MNTIRHVSPWSIVPMVLLGLCLSGYAQSVIVPFDSTNWELTNGELTTHNGRDCLMGVAEVNEVVFSDGVIEFDMFLSGARSYPGIYFRADTSGNYERIYFRPHRAGLYPDAVQYTPCINNVAGWQLYAGEGYTADAHLPPNEWLHVRVEIGGTQGRVYLGDQPEPVLTIRKLELGDRSGTIGLFGFAPNGSAYISNFSYRHDSTLAFEPPPPVETPEHALMNWEVSQTLAAEEINVEKYPRFFTFFFAEWYDVTADERGLVDIARVVRREHGTGDAVMARTVLYSDTTQTAKLTFGYSDEVAVFLNGHKVFNGRSDYQYRDRSFVGVVGLYDAVYLPLEKGLNEIMFIVTERFGGWGFMAQLDRALPGPQVDHTRLERVWETDSVFLTPESVIYDRKRKILYVSSFDNRYVVNNTDESTYTGYISKLRLDGTIEELKWVDRLNAPCGMAIRDDKLYTVERGFLTEIDIDEGTIMERFPVTESDFLNDLVVDESGAVYMTDTRPSFHPDSRIFRFSDGRCDDWLNEGIKRSNGLFVHDGRLIVGNSGDGLLKSVDLKTKLTRRIVCLGGRIIDGIRIDNNGNYLVSHWEGQLYRITPEGGIVELLDTQADQLNLADFEFIPEENLLIIPTFCANRVVAYKLID